MPINRWIITYRLGRLGRIRRATVVCIYQPSKEQAAKLLPHGPDEHKPIILSIKAAH